MSVFFSARVWFQVEDFSVESFAAALEYIHSGTCTTSALTVGGLVCAAALLELRELENICMSCTKKFLIDTPSFVSVVRGLEPYFGQHPAARRLFESVVAPYIESNASDILSSPGLATLNETALQLIYQCKLGSDETLKFRAAAAWAEAEASRRQNGDSTLADINETTRSLLTPLVKDLILHRMPPSDLMKLVKPSGSIPNERIMMALAFQVDPKSVQGLDGAPPGVVDALKTQDDLSPTLTERPISANENKRRASTDIVTVCSRPPYSREGRVRVTNL